MKKGEILKVEKTEVVDATILQEEGEKVLFSGDSFIICDDFIETEGKILRPVNPKILKSLSCVVDYFQAKKEEEDREKMMDKKSDELFHKIYSLYKSNPEHFRGGLYYSPGEELPIKNIRDFEDYDSFIQDVECELYDVNIDAVAYTEQDIFEYVLEKLKIFEEYKELDERHQIDIKDSTRELISVDVLSNLEENTNLYLDIFPFQDDNLDSEGSILRDDLSLLVNRLDGEKGCTIKKTSALYKLFKSQGYNINTFTLEDMEKSKFLKSFITEASEIYEFSPVFLTFLATTSIKEYFEILNGRKSIEIINGTCGLFDPVTGSSSVFEIELEKPFTISFTGEESFVGINVEDARGYGYNVGSVIGFWDKMWKAAYKLV